MAASLRSGACPLDVSTLVQSVGESAAALILDAVADEREHAERTADRRLELVWSGPEPDGAATRDTAVVIRELFLSAQRSVLVSGYAVYDGETIFRPLVEQMRAQPGLSVDMFLNIQRPKDNVEAISALVERFARRFFENDWPWPERPRIFYDERSLALSPADRAVMHAKCVVVDCSRAFVTSANLTDAALHRNIECGVLITDQRFATNLIQQFDGLRARGIVRAVRT